MAAQKKEDPAGDGKDPDIHELFCHYNSLYFDGELGACVVSWDTNLMTKYTGICHYEEGGYCEIHLSSLLKHRRGADLKSTLLHQMIHAYLWVNKQINDHGDHGRSFQELIDKIVSAAVDDLQRPIDGYSITSSHDFHEEVASHKVHHWICGVCGSLFEKSMHGQPSNSDCTEKVKHDESCGSSFCQWHSHKLLCSGNYMKMETSFGCDDTKETAEVNEEDQPKVSTCDARGHQVAHKDTQDIDNVVVRSVQHQGSSQEAIPSTSQRIMGEHQLGSRNNKPDCKKSETDENHCSGCTASSDDSGQNHQLDESVCLAGNKEENKKSFIRRSKTKHHPAVDKCCSSTISDHNFQSSNDNIRVYFTRRTAPNTCKLGCKDLSDARKLKSTVTDENRNGSNPHSTNVRSKRNPKRKKREGLDLTAFLHPVPGKARRSVRAASRKKLKCTEADSDEYAEFMIDHLEYNNDYSVSIGWSDWYADGEDEIEDTEHLINKRSERRKRQKLLINKKEVPRYDCSTPCGSPPYATVKQRKDRPPDESIPPCAVNPCKQNTRTSLKDEQIAPEAASVGLKFKSTEPPPSTCPANGKVALPPNCAAACENIPCGVDTPEDVTIPSESPDQNEIVEISDG